MLAQYGPWGLIVGGSEGIGAAFADELAAAGLNLLLVARTRERLERTADELRSRRPGREIRTLATDLSQEAGADEVVRAAQGLEIGLMIYNAGACSERRDFVDMDLDFNLGLATLNVTNKLRLTHAFAAPMRERRRGGVMLIGSSSYAAGNPGFATYSGVKAFSTLFSEGLWHELRPFGVHVLGYVVTFTATPAIARHYPEMAGQGSDPAEVARYGLAELANGPVAYCAGAEERIRTLMALPRAEAVERFFEASKQYRPKPR
jgi:short-subunit dehydrogenase